MAEFKNPSQQGGGDNRQFLVIMLVMVAVLFGLQYVKSKRNPQTESTAVAPNAQQSALARTGGPADTLPHPPIPGAVVPGSAGAEDKRSIPVVAGQSESTTTVENELYSIVFSNRGGQVVSWRLKRYKDAEGKPLDLVHEQAARDFGYPLSLYTYDKTLMAGLRQALYVPSATGLLSAPATLSFDFSDGNTVVKKTFTFDETYVMHADVQVTQAGAPVRALVSWPGGFGDQETAINYAQTQFDSARDGKATHVEAKKISGGDTLTGNYSWAGISDLYFAAIFLPDDPADTTIATLHNQLDVAKAQRHNGLGGGSPAKGQVLVPILGAAVGDQSNHTQTRLYAGPKSVAVLKSIHASGTGQAGGAATLEPLLDFGFFGIIGKGLFLALQYVHDAISSSASLAYKQNAAWGWAIVIITIVINVILLPLRVTTMKSGLKMQRIQPQMDAIKERYKKYKVTDPKRNEMNAEIMQLQKDNGVNMFGGCIPTLIQIPLLFAFLGMLPKVVELRQAHWGWLPDLSAADPFHILPILMIVSQFLVQFYTPSPGVDQQQQRMMAFMMPAFSGYITWNYASGLALYWAVGNLIMIAQQTVMMRSSIGREMKELAARRARRKIGSGGNAGAGSKLSATPKTIQGKPVRR